MLVVTMHTYVYLLSQLKLSPLTLSWIRHYYPWTMEHIATLVALAASKATTSRVWSIVSSLLQPLSARLKSTVINAILWNI